MVQGKTALSMHYILFLLIVLLALPSEAYYVDDRRAFKSQKYISIRQSGDCDVSFEVNAFIPARLGRSVRGLSGSWFLVKPPTRRDPTCVYGNTDNRGFGGGSSKLTVKGSFNLLDVGDLKKGDFKIQAGYSSVAGGIPGRKFVISPLSGLGTITSNKIDLKNGDDCMHSIIKIEAAAQNGAPIPDLVNPDIDIEAEVFVRKFTDSTGRVSGGRLSILIKTDSFPDYECLINGALEWKRKTSFATALLGIVGGLPGKASVSGSCAQTISCTGPVPSEEPACDEL